MSSIKSFNITKLWGNRNIDLTFHKDVNLLIGPNASGKTTILNLLHSILTMDLRSISDIDFEEAVIELGDFKTRDIRSSNFSSESKDGRDSEISPIENSSDSESPPTEELYASGFEDEFVHTATVTTVVEKSRFLKMEIDGEESFSFELDIISGRLAYTDETGSRARRTPSARFVRERTVPKELYDKVSNLVPLVWLPVSRRLLVSEYDEERYKANSLESVDVRLNKLLEGVSRYHTILNAQLSERYREFERQVLSAILYSKDQDQPHLILESIRSASPTEDEKNQLLGAFEAAGFLDEQMASRINEHFAAAKESVERIRASKDADLGFVDTLILPLINRTKDMVKYARELEKDREAAFATLRLYEDSVNSFLHNKSIKVDHSGRLKVGSSSPTDLDPLRLSSGEKQILILLTEALLQSDRPVVYIADEPELSLHVIWQEKLLKSLVELGGEKIQLIVATHSPDIVGEYFDNIIDLEEENQ